MVNEKPDPNPTLEMWLTPVKPAPPTELPPSAFAVMTPVSAIAPPVDTSVAVPAVPMPV